MLDSSIVLLSANTDTGDRKIRQQMKILLDVKSDNVIFIIVRALTICSRFSVALKIFQARKNILTGTISNKLREYLK